MEPVKFVTIGTTSLFTQYCEETTHLVIDDRGLHLPEQACYEFPGIMFSRPGLDLRDLAVDECGTLYLLDGGTGRILMQDSCRGPFIPLGCPYDTLPIALTDPRAIDLDRRTLYIGDGNRLIALSRRNLQVRWILDRNPDGTPLGKVVDLTVDRMGRIHLLESRRTLILDCGGRILGQINLSGTATDLCFTPDGGLAVLGLQSLFLISKDALTGAIRDGHPKPEQRNVRIDVENPAGLVSSDNGYFIIGTGTSRVPEPALFRMEPQNDVILSRITSYRGFTRRLAIDRSGNLYLISGTGEALYLIRQADPLHMTCPLPDPAGTFSGTYWSRVVDSRNRDTRWHRFVIDGIFPSGTGIGLQYAISNDPFPVEWHEGLPGSSVNQGERRRDGLFLADDKGRYLWFSVRLQGTSTRSPEVSRITVYFPRSTYLEFLPAVYQEDEVSSDFLERFLSLFESTWGEIDNEIDHLTRYFDPYGTPPEFLPWLGSWVALSMDEAWPETMQRWLIQNAVRLYKMRGTPAGLVEVIEEFLWEKLGAGRVYILENLPPPCPTSKVACYRCQGETGLSVVKEDDAEVSSAVPVLRECWEGELPTVPEWQSHGCLYYPPTGVKPILCAVQAEHWPAAEREMTLSQILFGGALFCFCVLIAGVEPEEADLQAIRRIISEWKPAHTCSSLKVLLSGIALDGLTFLGVNTTLSGPGFIIGRSVLGRGAVLTDLEDGGRLAPPVKIGIDSRLS
ncbi:MAG: hypothetical protein APR53_02875 [Methanoculleus sp. SDB]|nr:MAG: hypothetical protein APR53_02875 [Methanoculleus sp. SDB]